MTPANSTDASSPISQFAEQSDTIGLIGIGLMGTVIAERFIHAGMAVYGWDSDPDRCRVLESLGGKAASSASEVLSKCRRVALSLPSHETVAEVINSCATQMRAGQIIIDLSTGEPDAAVKRATSLKAREIEYLDATVSGSSEQLKRRDAIMLVGATDAAYESCRDVFDCLAKKTFHTGLPGSGARMKLVTNLVLGLNRAALAEGLCFANHLGLDLEQTLHMLRESMSYSRIMDTKGEKMIRRDFTPQARLSQHLKDVRLIIDAAGPKAYLPLSETHRSLLERAELMDLGELDNSAILEAIAAGKPAVSQE